MVMVLCWLLVTSWGLAGAKLSKCAQTHLRAREEARASSRAEWSGAENSSLEVTEMVGQLSGPAEPSSYPRNIEDLYPSCRHYQLGAGVGPEDVSIIVDFNNGRLGNQVSSLASTLCLARHNQLRPMMTHKTAEHLASYFTGLADTLPVLESQFCSPWRDLAFVNIEKMSGNKGQVVNMPTYPNMVELYPGCLAELRDALQLRPEFRAEADRFLARLRAEAGLEAAPLATVHVRRTDHPSFLRSLGQEAATPEYFQRAMDTVREHYPNVVFVVVSDDMEWCRRHVRGRDVRYSPWGGDKSVAGAGADLALLTRAAVSVLSHGTFGQWGALLAPPPPRDQRPGIIAPRGHELERMGDTGDRNMVFI